MKKIILFMLITCLACQIVGCKAINSNKPKDNTNKDSATSDQDSSSAEDSTNESEASEAQDSSGPQTPSTDPQTPSTDAQTPSPITPTTPTTPTTPKPPVSPNQNGSEQANFGSSEVLEVEEIEEVEIPKVEGEIVTVTSHTALAREQYYQYSGLNASEKQIYHAIYDGIKQCETYINLNAYGCNKETLDKVYHAVTGDNPQFFYLTNLYAYSTWGSRIDKLILLYMDGTNSDVLDDEMAAANHIPHTTGVRVPSCTSKTHAFYNDFALYVENLTAAPSNYKKVIDYVVSQGEKTLCIYGEAGSEKMQDYISKQIFGSKSEVQKYIKSKGYKISFELQYYISGKYFYIRIK